MRFSVITCTYNSGRYLQDNIDSVLGQDFTDFEHIFIDGRSTDETSTIIEKYRQELPGKVSVYSRSPKGIANAMNEGIKVAKGDYIIHLHSDDSLYSNDVLRKISEFAERHKEPDWIYGKAKFIGDNGKFRIIPHRKIYQKARLWLLLLTNYIPHQAVVLKKEVFAKYGLFDESLKSVMDYEFWMRLAKGGVGSDFINVVLCNFSVRNDSQSSTRVDDSEELTAIGRYVDSPIILKVLAFIYRLNKKRNFFS